VFAELLGVPAGSRYPPLRLTPHKRKVQTFRALLAQLEGLARHMPVLVVLEDGQWFDPTTLELFDVVVGRIERLSVLLVVTFRPEFRPPWLGRAHVTLLTLSRLGRSQAAEVVARVTDGRALPAEAMEQILAKTDGIPLFVEELTKAVLEAGLLREEGDRYVLQGPLPPLAIPDTLHGSLLARLDRLAPVKEVAQVGAVIGREFDHELLAAVAGMDEARLGAALRQLIEAELVFPRGVPPEAAYAFKHALVQEAAYAFKHALVQEAGLRQPAQGPPPTAARPHRRGARTAPPRDGGQAAGGASPPSDRGGPRGARARVLGSGRHARAGTVGEPRGDGAPRQGPPARRDAALER
jgi:predicted ATPase